MRLIDADELVGQIERSKKCFFNTTDKEIALNYIYQAPTVNEWHYTAAGELPPKLEENHPMSYKCIVAIKGIISGKTYIDIARYDFSGKAWFSYPEGRVNVYAWKVEDLPKEEA